MPTNFVRRVTGFITLNLIEAFLRVKNTEEETVRLGSLYGGWYVPKDLSRWEVDGGYFVSAGVGEDISFDLDLIDKTGLKGILIDPTEKSLKYVSAFNTSNHPNATGIKIITSQEWSGAGNQAIGSERLTFINVALWKDNFGIKLIPPKNPAYVSYSLRGDGEGEHFESASLAQILFLFQECALIKLDIEGSELAVLESFVRIREQMPKVILFELDFLREPRMSDFFRFLRITLHLRRLGYRLLRIDGLNVSLIRIG